MDSNPGTRITGIANTSVRVGARRPSKMLGISTIPQVSIATQSAAESQRNTGAYRTMCHPLATGPGRRALFASHPTSRMVKGGVSNCVQVIGLNRDQRKINVVECGGPLSRVRSIDHSPPAESNLMPMTANRHILSG
jgi:hypothetical protein